MEYCQRTLEKHLSETAPLFPASVTRLTTLSLYPTIRIGGDISSGLAYIHEQGAVHRDLKPRNGTFNPRECGTKLISSTVFRTNLLLEDC
jgi:serine/threonine protein kinase